MMLTFLMSASIGFAPSIHAPTIQRGFTRTSPQMVFGPDSVDIAAIATSAPATDLASLYELAPLLAPLPDGLAPTLSSILERHPASPEWLALVSDPRISMLFSIIMFTTFIMNCLELASNIDFHRKLKRDR